MLLLLLLRRCRYLLLALLVAAGFLALLSSPMPILRSFGLFAGVGLAWCLVFTFGLGVWLLPLARPAAASAAPSAPGAGPGAAFPTPRPAANRSGANFNAPRAVGAALGRLYGWVWRWRRPLVLLSLALTLGLLAGLPRLRADTYTLGYFPDNHPVVRDHRAIAAAWGPYLPLELLVRPRPGLALHSPEVQQATQRLADTLRRAVPGVAAVFGFHSLYQAGLESRFGPGPRSARALGSRSLLRLTHERLQADFPTLLRQFEAADGRTGRLTLSGPMLSARQLTAKTDSVRRLAAAVLAGVATVEPAGYGPLYARIVAYVTTSQTQSLFYSVLVVLGLVWAVVRSRRLALLTVLPNLFPVLAVLGLMGWLGIRLDTATASIAAIVLSLSVDDTLHFVLHYRRQRRQLGPAAARRATITHVGPAIVLTGLILFCGYSFMLLGSLKTVQLFGLLTAISIVAALFGELIIFPLVLAWFDKEA
ncbi:RND family transporter [uncultured Hymenobacter sp.]|uniref:efflux RND transporter permease subunit n=1 Tax=uncultured Hymenobacter sp. TaxID=170016 RepID=UPI0035CC1075